MVFYITPIYKSLIEKKINSLLKNIKNKSLITISEEKKITCPKLNFFVEGLPEELFFIEVELSEECFIIDDWKLIAFDDIIIKDYLHRKIPQDKKCKKPLVFHNTITNEWKIVDKKNINDIWDENKTCYIDVILKLNKYIKTQNIGCSTEKKQTLKDFISKRSDLICGAFIPQFLTIIDEYRKNNPEWIKAMWDEKEQKTILGSRDIIIEMYKNRKDWNINYNLYHSICDFVAKQKNSSKWLINMKKVWSEKFCNVQEIYFIFLAHKMYMDNIK